MLRALVVALAVAGCAGPRVALAPLPVGESFSRPHDAGVPVLVVREVHANPNEIVMVSEAVSLANRVMASPCFKAGVLDAAFTETRGMTAPQVWQELASVEISLRIVYYRASWWATHVYGTVGYENDDTPDVVYVNRRIVDTVLEAASNMIHEGEGHTQGFRHDDDKWPSVPYTLNRIFERCAGAPVAPVRRRLWWPPSG